VLEPVERWVIFRTNQGTDAHLKRAAKLNLIRPYTSVIVKGFVAASPKIVPRRHVIFPIKDESGQVDCAAYEPTGLLRRVAMKLIVGDYMEAYGAVRAPSQSRPLTINLEKIRLLKLVPEIAHKNPVCPNCGRRLKSMGRSKGFRCERCGFRTTSLKKTETRIKREIEKGLYITSTRSQRHLTKPTSRYGMERSHETVDKLIEDWHFP
jgi:tRNA(Ile2)-agmatinylcytidine synthase